MKAFRVILLAAMAVTSFPALAQKLNAAKVPVAVKAAFIKAHPGTKVRWDREDKDYEAGFTVAGKEASEVYSAAGIKLSSETEINVSELPATVISYVKTHYKGAKIAEAAKIVNQDGVVNYEAEVKGKDLVFDAKGSLIK
ncbi:PepSY-like domain-containing protein [Hufsiella ginkgonis]|uniref:Putative beta-lactamase-inhibitor-like PepSY-like domain-containing protein n=1 Tax=Hufsiella ginkgonis TaxID=2695274 RepID=A0A7K1XSW0_9SPHI|nr:PepSY-like domain-containing protein [Hufsiella ginkgonis]MXV14032.1 hypothetical protein [Hufsiella ginkgonis]